MDVNAALAAGEPVLRSEPDPTRKAVSTAVAATRCQLSRYYVSELVRQGKLDGYGVRRHEGGRTRWYVYLDALPPEKSEETEIVSADSYDQELLSHLLDAREHARLAREERTGAHRLLVDVIDGMTAALRAAQLGDTQHAFDLLLVAQEIRNDEGRRLLKAQQHEADAEACLDAVLRLLPPGEEVKSHTKDNFASPGGSRSRGRGPLAFPGSRAPDEASAHD